MGNNICCQTTQKIQFQTQVIVVRPPEASLPPVNPMTSNHIINIDQQLDNFPLIKRIIQLDDNKAFINSLGNRDVLLSSGFITQLSDGRFISQSNLVSKRKNGYGILIGKDQTYYEGYWVDDFRNGKGILVTKQGQYYSGDWKYNCPHGFGIYSCINPFYYYKGQWQEGLKHGQGLQNLKDGSKYIGQFYYGQKEGYGRLIYQNKTEYQGDFKSNIQDGIGIYRGKNHIYEGSWVNGKMHGPGKSQWRNNNQQVIGRYVGQYRNGIKQGYGEYIDGKGTVFKAMWINGQISEQTPIDIQKIQKLAS